MLKIHLKPRNLTRLVRFRSLFFYGLLLLDQSVVTSAEDQSETCSHSAPNTRCRVTAVPLHALTCLLAISQPEITLSLIWLFY